MSLLFFEQTFQLFGFSGFLKLEKGKQRLFWCVLSRTGALDFMQPGARQGAVEFERIARFPADIGLTYGRNVQEHVAGSQRAASRRLDGLVQQNMTFDSPHDTLVSSEQMNNVLRFDAEEVDNSKKQRWRERLLGYDGGDPPSDPSGSLVFGFR